MYLRQKVILKKNGVEMELSRGHASFVFKRLLDSAACDGIVRSTSLSDTEEQYTLMDYASEKFALKVDRWLHSPGVRIMPSQSFMDLFDSPSAKLKYDTACTEELELVDHLSWWFFRMQLFVSGSAQLVVNFKQVSVIDDEEDEEDEEDNNDDDENID